jgi:hypothetical protein
MGLDQYLYAKKLVSGQKRGEEPLTVVPNPDYDNIIKAVGGEELPEQEWFPHVTISIKVAQWRKSNQIHMFFVDSCQDGVDDCRSSYVSQDVLDDLLQRCNDVLNDHSKAEELLPTTDGFFFGESDYGDWYFEDLAYTKEVLEKLNALEGDWGFEYKSSW